MEWMTGASDQVKHREYFRREGTFKNGSYNIIYEPFSWLLLIVGSSVSDSQFFELHYNLLMSFFLIYKENIMEIKFCWISKLGQL